MFVRSTYRIKNIDFMHTLEIEHHGKLRYLETNEEVIGWEQLFCSKELLWNISRGQNRTELYLELFGTFSSTNAMFVPTHQTNESKLL